MRGKLAGLLLLGSALIAPPPPAEADPIADFFAAHELALVTAGSPGGQYDVLTRFLARYLGRFVPGNPRVIVKNMAGAGGIVLGNYLYASAPRDGSVIAGLTNNVAFEPLFGTAEAKYNPLQFNWVAGSNAETAFLTVWHTVPVRTLADARAREITVGASGAASSPTFFARLLNETLHTRLKIIVGYPGSNEAFLAMENGELDGYPSAFTSDLTAAKLSLVRDGKLRLIVQYGPHPEPDFAQVPFAPDQVSEPADKALMSAAFALLDIGRPFALPPGTPPERVAALRQAFAAMLHDSAVLADAKSLGIGIDRSRSGAELLALVRRDYETPPAVIERLKLLKLQ